MKRTDLILSLIILLTIFSKVNAQKMENNYIAFRFFEIRQ